MANELTILTDIQASTEQARDAHNILAKEISKLRSELKLQSIMLARMMAQLDPLFVIPEDHPLRRDDSDRIAKAVMKKLKGEYLASNPGTQEF